MSEVAAPAPAAMGTTTEIQSTSAPPPTPTDWTSGLNPELKGYVTTKGFKDTAAVVESYRNFEKLQGVPQDRLLKLPENLDSPEGRAIFEKLGMPKDAKDYNVKISEDFADETFGDWLRGVAHKNGMTNRQVEGFVQALNERAGNDSKTQKEAHEAMLTNAHKSLQKEWGHAYEQNKNLADQGAIAFGFGEKEVQALGQALGPDKAMMLLHKLGTGTGEASFVAGRPTGGDALTPDQAKLQISELTRDGSFYRRLTSGDADARRIWDRLNQQAAPGTMSL